MAPSVDVGTFTSLGTPEQSQALIAELGVTYPTAPTLDSGVMLNDKDSESSHIPLLLS